MLTNVDDAFRLTPTLVQVDPSPVSVASSLQAPEPIKTQSTGYGGSKQPRMDLERQILLLQQEICRLKNEQSDMDQLPPPYPI